MSLSKMPPWQYYLTKATNSLRKFGLDRNGNPNYGRVAINFFSKQNSQIDKILAIRLEGLARKNVGCSPDKWYGFGLGAWPLEALAPIFYWLFSTHFLGLPTKFDLSIPRPLDLDGHSVKRPLYFSSAWCGVDVNTNPKKTCVQRRLDYMCSKHGNHSRLNTQHDWEKLSEHLVNT